MFESKIIISEAAIRSATLSMRIEAARDRWAQCDEFARALLLQDESSMVRNAARYQKRDFQIASLSAKGSVTPEDLHDLDRIGRCSVANELWGICTTEARSRLLDDSHHFVRSCASISARQFSPTN